MSLHFFVFDVLQNFAWKRQTRSTRRAVICFLFSAQHTDTSEQKLDQLARQKITFCKEKTETTAFFSSLAKEKNKVNHLTISNEESQLLHSVFSFPESQWHTYICKQNNCQFSMKKHYCFSLSASMRIDCFSSHGGHLPQSRAPFFRSLHIQCG